MNCDTNLSAICMFMHNFCLFMYIFMFVAMENTFEVIKFLAILTSISPFHPYAQAYLCLKFFFLFTLVVFSNSCVATRC
jgi:hypothetical protein